MAVFNLDSLTGGLDDTTALSALAPDACTVAENVEFVNSTLGERRAGCTAVTLPAGAIVSTYDAATWMYRHLPDNTSDTAELWVLFQSLSTADNILMRRNQTTWATITPTDAITSSTPKGHQMCGQTLHGKLFLAHKSGQNRMHVYDGTDLRRAGLAAPAAPAVADQGAGTYSGTRYFRVRYAKLSGSTVLLRSEPSTATTFSPSGGGASARVTKPAAISEGETHWEVEASTDNVLFYRIARVVVGTTTYDDSTAYSTGYNSGTNVLSEDVGDYTLIPSGKFLGADDDRLLIAGSWETAAEESRVRWTPKLAADGVGNDERLMLDTDPFLDLDGYEGGGITGLSRVANGYWYIFKLGHIYKMVRSGKVNAAYEAIAITKSRGAFQGSIIEGSNEAGFPTIFFLDPNVGPMLIGPNGLQWCGADIQTVWGTVNTNAKVPCHGVYYSDKRQIHYWIAVDGSDYPNKKIIVHTNEMRTTEEGVRRGWVTTAKNDRISTAHCSTMFASNIDSSDVRTIALVPFIGKEKWTVPIAGTRRDYVQRCDTGTKDAHTEYDESSTYRGKIRTRPFFLAGLFQQSEVKHAALFAKANDEPSGYVYIRAIGDFGKEEKYASADLTATADETHVVKQLDGIAFGGVYALQFELGDVNTAANPASAWELNALAVRYTAGQSG